MKAAFFHDGPTYIDKQNNYYACILSNELIERYFYFADEFLLVNRLRCLPDEKLSGLEKITHKNTKIIEIPNIASLHGVLYQKNQVKEIIKKAVNESDIIIARLPSITGGFAIEAANKYNKPYFIELVGCTWDALWNYGIKGKILAPMMYVWMRKLVKNSPFVLYITKEFLQKRYPNKGFSVEVSDVDLVPEDESVLTNRLNKIEKGSDVIILGTMAGVDTKYKGQKHVIKAISILKKQNYNLEYHLAGGGDTTYLEKLARKYQVYENVKFLGSIPHEKVFHYLDNIDIYIQPSDAEAKGRSLIEAMSRGCPSMGSKIGGIPELLDRPFLFDKGNVKQICKIIQSYSKNKMIQQAKRNFKLTKEFNQSNLDKKRKEFYDIFLEKIERS